MRVLFALALIALSLAGVTAANAGAGRGYSTLGQRAAPLVIYDYQPGVIVRAYWLAPWRQRHYYPTTGEKPEVGRDEDLSAVSGNLPEAETFERHWSTCAACLVEQPRAPNARPAPPLDQPPENPGPLK